MEQRQNLLIVLAIWDGFARITRINPGGIKAAELSENKCVTLHSSLFIRDMRVTQGMEG
jgi:hypothetical protein